MASADQQIEPTNPEFPLLSIRFIDSLSRIKSKKPLGRNQEINCARKIKIAAYASMAAGKNRKWSRALLRKQKTRKTKKIVKNRPRRPDLVVKQEDKLRKLVPGGEEMEICSLIDETGDYIRCLELQVRVMQCLVDEFSKR